MGSVLKNLKLKQEPLIIERNKDPVAVLISYETFKARFVDLQEKAKVNKLVSSFKANLKPTKRDPVAILRELRYGED